MRILFVDDDKPSLVMYPQTDGFLRALSSKCEVSVTSVDTAREEYDLRLHEGYDVILVWQSVTSHRRKNLVRRFLFPENVCSCAVISDFFHPAVKRSPVIFNPFMAESLRQSQFDYVFTTYHNTYEWSLLLPSIKVRYLPYCVDTEFFVDLRRQRKHALLVCCSSNSYLYPFRARVIDLLHNQTIIPCHFKVNSDEQWGNTTEQMELDDASRRVVGYDVLRKYRDLLSTYTAFLATTSIGDGVELKFAEAILCGACVVGDVPESMFERYHRFVTVIHSCMTDGEILERMDRFMKEPTAISERRDEARDLISEEFGPDSVAREFLKEIDHNG